MCCWQLLGSWAAYLLLCLDWYIIFSFILGIFTLQFGLECKTTHFCNFKWKNALPFCTGTYSLCLSFKMLHDLEKQLGEIQHDRWEICFYDLMFLRLGHIKTQNYH